MKKKSLVAMGLAGVMTVGMCVPVLAAEDSKFGPTDETTGAPLLSGGSGSESSASVTIIEPITYTVTIPKSFTVNGIDASIKVSVENVNLEPDYNITIKPQSGVVTLANDKKSDVKWNMKFMDGEEEFTSVSFNNESSALEKSISLKNGTNSDLMKRPAGTYTGNTTFTVSYEKTAVTP